MVMMSISPDIPWSQYKQPHDSGIHILQTLLFYFLTRFFFKSVLKTQILAFSLKVPC